MSGAWLSAGCHTCAESAGAHSMYWSGSQAINCGLFIVNCVRLWGWEGITGLFWIGGGNICGSVGCIGVGGGGG